MGRMWLWLGIVVSLAFQGAGEPQLRAVHSALALLKASSPLDHAFEFETTLLDELPPSPSEDNVSSAANELLTFAQEGSSRALLSLALSRLYSTVIPRAWFLSRGSSIGVVFDAIQPTAPVCSQLGLQRLLSHGMISVNLSTAAGAVIALGVVACQCQSRLEAVATAAADLQSALHQGRTFTGDPAVLSWYTATRAISRGVDSTVLELNRRSSAWVSADDQPELDQDARAAAKEDLDTPWVIDPSWDGLALSEGYVPVGPGVALLESLADEYADIIEDSSTSLTALGLLHLSAFRINAGCRDALAAAPGPPHPAAPYAPESFAGLSWIADTLRVAVNAFMTALVPFWLHPSPSFTGNSDVGGEGIFDRDVSAYEALALAAMRRSSERAILAIAFAASQSRLPAHLVPARGESRSSDHIAEDDASCALAIDWVMSLSEDVARDDGSSEYGLSPDDAAPRLWEAHEDALSGIANMEDTEWLRQLADDNDDPEAHMELGELHLFGDPLIGERPNRAEAFRHFQRAAALGLPDAHARLGSLMLAGLGSDGSVDDADDGARNLTQARIHLETAADLGSTDALVALGYLYLDGAGGVERDATRALELFEQAAGLGSIAAHHGVAAIYMQPNLKAHDGGILENRTRAREHFEIAAAYGFSPSQFDLANLLREGAFTSDSVSVQNGAESPCRSALRLFVAVAEKSVASHGNPSIVSAYKEYESETPEATEAAFLQYLTLSSLGLGPALDNAAFILLSPHARQLSSFIDTKRAASLPLFGPNTLGMSAPLTPRSVLVDSRASNSDAGPLSLRACAYGLFLSAAVARKSPSAMAAVGDCLSARWTDIHWCLLGSDAAASAAATEWYEHALEQGSGHAAFALAIARASGSYGGDLSVPVNLTSSWELLDRLEEIDYLADGVALVGRAFVFWQDLSGGGGFLGAARGAVTIVFQCASLTNSSSTISDACFIFARAGLATICVAILLLAVVIPLLLCRAANPDGIRAVPNAAHEA